MVQYLADCSRKIMYDGLLRLEFPVDVTVVSSFCRCCCHNNCHKISTRILLLASVVSSALLFGATIWSNGQMH